MIRYQLTCPKSHAFEGWFQSSAAFDVQVKKKLVTCPSCGSAKVEKALMAPNVVTSEQKTASRKKRALQRGQELRGQTPGESASVPFSRFLGFTQRRERHCAHVERARIVRCQLEVFPRRVVRTPRCLNRFFLLSERVVHGRKQRE